MSRFLRQSSQLARVTRLTSQPALRACARPSIITRSIPAKTSAAFAIRARAYSSQPPPSGKDPRSNPDKDTEHGSKPLNQHKAKDGSEGGKAEAPKPSPLPEGWIHLSKDEIAHLEQFTGRLPEAQRPVAKDILEKLQIVGAPAETRDLLEKLRVNGNLSILDKGRLMRCVYMVTERIVELEDNENQDGPFSSFRMDNESKTNDGKAGAKEDGSHLHLAMLLIISSVLLAVVSAQQCSFENGDMSAKWQVANGELVVELTNKNMGNDQWMGIGFGPDMSNLDVVLFLVQNNKASMVTGITRGYAPPTLDNSAAVNRELVQYNSNTLTGRFSRPLTSSGPRNLDLSGCSTWNFVAGGPIRAGAIGKHFNRPIQMRVCPQQCIVSGFVQRNVATDPLPMAAVYNNRQSSRFNGLHPSYYGK